MKKYLCIMTIILAALLSGCTVEGQYEPYQPTILDIIDEDFDVQVLRIQHNREYYIGRTVRMQGIFTSSNWDGEHIYFVTRRIGGGCCGSYGFEVYLNNLPPVEDETWVEIVGVMEEFNVGGRYFLRINLDLLEER